MRQSHCLWNCQVAQLYGDVDMSGRHFSRAGPLQRTLAMEQASPPPAEVSLTAGAGAAVAETTVVARTAKMIDVRIFMDSSQVREM
jgi:hypothetical protein